ncbi:MAG TPA: hypothetical protein VGE69_00980 [Pseudomonadales bacterium]
MGCLSSPKPVKATAAEQELANLAGEKYQYSQRITEPLQAYDRADADKLTRTSQRQRLVDRAANSARSMLPTPVANPNQKSRLMLENNGRATVMAAAGGAGENAADRITANKKVRNLATGLRLSISGSQGLQRSAASAAGLKAAQSSATQYMKDAGMGALGQAVGSLGTAGAYKTGAFNPKTPAAPKPEEINT